jgi:3-carboxy-cis,cis-muconate cycloisomerase
MTLARPLATTDALSAIFADTAIVQALLDVEAALARVQARLGVIPTVAVEAIVAEAADASGFDAAALAAAARESGSIAIPLIAELTARVRRRDADAAKYVHWGATSQDIVDTALVRLAGRAADVLARDHAELVSSLRSLSDRHAADVMLGRTLLQPAPPITFGLKAAEWLGGVNRAWTMIDAARVKAAVLQFGGASGTLAALGDRGPAIADALARELGLDCPAAPWHSERDRLAALVSACGIYTGMLGKIARDVTLLMQAEVAEASEPGGGSSTMPHKRNPAGCAIVLAAAARLPGLVAASLGTLVQEHERSAGAWHAEWPIVTDAIQTTGAALEAMGRVADRLAVNPARMAHNLAETGGDVFAERVMMRVAPALGRDRAHELLREALDRTRLTRAPLRDVLRGIPEIAALLTDTELRAIDDPAGYLGSAELFRRRLLDESSERVSASPRTRSGDRGAPASGRVGGSAGAKPSGERE